MKALSLRNPWAWFILNGGKDVENRGWTTSYRGPVLIHTSKWWKEDEVEDDLDFAEGIARRQNALTAPIPSLADLKKQCGHIVGVVDIVESVLGSESEWFFGPKAFVLANPVVFVDPVPCRGDRGLFNVHEDVASSCRAQIDLARSKRR